MYIIEATADVINAWPLKISKTPQGHIHTGSKLPISTAPIILAINPFPMTFDFVFENRANIKQKSRKQ